MISYLNVFYKTMIDICKLEKGPADIQSSIPLLLGSLLFYFLARFGVEQFLMPVQSAGLVALASTAVFFLVPFAILAIQGLKGRTTQTVITLVTISTVVTFVLFILYCVLYFAPSPLLATDVKRAFTFPIILWTLAVNAHVFREALSSNLFIGGLLALLLWFCTDHVTSSLLTPSESVIAQKSGGMSKM